MNVVLLLLIAATVTAIEGWIIPTRRCGGWETLRVNACVYDVQ